MKRLVIVDADPIFYIVGWQMQENYDAILACSAIDALLASIRAYTGSEDLLLCMDSGHKSFRHKVYKYAPYKGTRPSEKPEFFQRFEALFRDHLVKEHGAVSVAGLEADDLVAYAAGMCRKAGAGYVISSPDKDLCQITGAHMNYAKIDKGGEEVYITEADAKARFWAQMLMGDTTDNIKGLPGMGPVKVEKLFKVLEVDALKTAVYEKFMEYFGNHYGEVIFRETYAAVHMIDSAERLEKIAEWFPQEIQQTVNYPQLLNFENYVEQRLEQLATPGGNALEAEFMQMVSAAADQAGD